MQPKQLKVKTIIFLKKEDDLNIFENGRRPQFFLKEDDLIFFKNGRQPETK